jgi:hypothetical protein
MGRSWYDRLRSEFDDGEIQRLHATMLVPGDPPPSACPACDRPVTGWKGLTVHLAAVMDRAPDPGDLLMGLPLTVVPGDGPPRLEGPWPHGAHPAP